MKTSLNNKRVLITRAREQASSFSEKIRHYGGIPLEVPLIATQLPKERAARDRIKAAIERIDYYDWLIFTSANGVRSFFSLWDQYANFSIDRLRKCKIAVVGPKTMAPLNERGLVANVMPDIYEASHLYAALKDHLVGNERILLARGNLAKTEIVDSLRQLGCEATDLVVYETVRNEQAKEQLYTYIQNKEVDVITFTSPSTVEYFVTLLEGADWRAKMNDVLIACIGTVTREAAIEHGFHVEVMPQHFTVDDLVEELVRYFRSAP